MSLTQLHVTVEGATRVVVGYDLLTRLTHRHTIVAVR